jgi:hypothetical protein
MGWELEIDAPVNGRIRKADITVLDDAGQPLGPTAQGNLYDAKARKKVVAELAEQMPGVSQEEIAAALNTGWKEVQKRNRAEQKAREAGSKETAEDVSAAILDSSPDTIRRPLSLVGGQSYAATWLHVRVTVRQELNRDGELVRYDPPQERVEQRLVVVRGDGVLFADEDAHLPAARPLRELGLSVALPTAPTPSRLWSGAGVKAFLAGGRPRPAEVFGRVVSVVDAFMDFGRSFGSQGDLCELTASYVIATYLLDAFNVVGYLWPNGDKGSGKTNYLSVVTELAYLGQLVLAGGTYASLRDLADYGATLAFDDAEGVMDLKRTDPDKRALLLAGNRRGATVTVKELSAEKVWVTRHVNTFCPRLFSAIRLPDGVLASRTITLPLVRSADPNRAKASPSDPDVWPCDRRQLVDDLWAVGLAHLPELKQYDARAAAQVSLSGRDLEPWRAMLAVALWLQDRHGVPDLFRRVEGLMLAYQRERGDFEATHDTRVLFKALLELTTLATRKKVIVFSPKELAEQMNQLAREDDLVEGGERFTSPRKVGWLLKQQRFRRGGRRAKGKLWQASRQEIVSLAKAYGVTTGRKKP